MNEIELTLREDDFGPDRRDAPLLLPLLRHLGPRDRPRSAAAAPRSHAPRPDHVQWPLLHVVRVGRLSPLGVRPLRRCKNAEGQEEDGDHLGLHFVCSVRCGGVIEEPKRPAFWPFEGERAWGTVERVGTERPFVVFIL